MSKIKQFILSAFLIAIASLSSRYGLDFIAIPLAILAIVILGNLLKGELGLCKKF